MRKIIQANIFLLLFCMTGMTAQSQTLFTYGNKKVDKNAFLEAFKKSPSSGGSRQEQIKNYLNLYIDYKLKLQSALDEKLNESDSYKVDADNFRKQLAETYINKQADVNALLNQAFERSQKDILLQQVFIEVPNDGDTLPAFKKMQEAYKELQSGKNFEATARTFSSDTSAINVGYITVFTLPYSIENNVYALRPEQYSGIVKSRAGYHIFKNAGERPAKGLRKIQQILFSVPPSYSAIEKMQQQKIADSVYQLLLKGASFEDMMRMYNLAPSAVYGEVKEIRVGDFSNNFENEIFALRSPGEISKPFATEYGFNIIKLKEIVPVATDESDAGKMAELQQRLTLDSRVQKAKNNLLEKWKKEIHFTPAKFDASTLFNYTAAWLQNNPLENFPAIQNTTLLFTLDNEKITVANWLEFATNQHIQPESTMRAYQDLMHDFENMSVKKYYIAHIENYYPDFAGQLEEFNDANLIFAAMDQHVWTPAINDTTALNQYYLGHMSNYSWKPGFSALAITAPTKDMAEKIAADLKNNSTNWRTVVATYGADVLADSSRFENGELPVHALIIMQEGYQTAPEKNDGGDAYTFMQVIKVIPENSPRNYADAKGLVMNDYQQMLEDKWLATLKEKYPVKVDEEVVKGL